MGIDVEPGDGQELDRLITAVLNVTGVVKHAIDDAVERVNGDGVEVIGAAADRPTLRTRSEALPRISHAGCAALC